MTADQLDHIIRINFDTLVRILQGDDLLSPDCNPYLALPLFRGAVPVHRVEDNSPAGAGVADGSGEPIGGALSGPLGTLGRIDCKAQGVVEGIGGGGFRIEMERQTGGVIRVAAPGQFLAVIESIPVSVHVVRIGSVEDQFLVVAQPVLVRVTLVLFKDRSHRLVPAHDEGERIVGA